MSESRRYGLGGQLPGTLRRSCQEAQVTFIQAHEDALQTYGEGDQAYQAAFTVLKQKFEKRGDHWIAKADPAA